MSAPAELRLRSLVIASLYVEFALTGTITVLIGPLLPLFAKSCSMSDANAGSLVAAQFAGGMIGALFANRDLRVSVFTGMPLIAIGVGGLGFSSCTLSYLCTACYGLGLGLTMAAINLIVAKWHSGQQAYSLTLLNFFWGVGAFGSPLLVEWARRHQLLPWTLLGLGAASLGLWLLVILSKLPSPAAPETRPGESWYAASLLFFGALFFLYVGVETSLGDWTALYATRMPYGNDSIAAWSVGCFWLALLSGRLLNAALLRRLPGQVIYRVSLAITLAGISLYLVSRSSLQVLLAASVSAFGLAPLFPLMLSSASDSLLACRYSGWVFASASLGGTVIPWLTGQASARFGSLRVALMVPGSAALLIVALGLARREKSPGYAGS